MPGPDQQDESLRARQPGAAPAKPNAIDSAETSTTPVVTPASMNLDSDRFEILTEVGRGGMGIVYLARDRETGEQVALKVLKPEVAADPVLQERFKNELRLARKITHRNVCRIYDFNRTASAAFITMEYVQGESLRQYLKRSGPLPWMEGTRMMRQICAGLHEAQVQGIVHRDLKPENIMLDTSREPKIMDFGIARSVDPGSTLTGMFVGTPAYMAPEQAEGKRVDGRTDLYALGLMLYEIFTGTAAFRADTPLALALKQVNEAPARPRDLQPDIPAGLEEIILRCLQKDPAQRFQEVAELDAALARQLEGIPIRPATGTTPSSAVSADLPKAPRSVTRALLCLIQVTYGVTYVVALAMLDGVHDFAVKFLPGSETIVVAAVLGIGLVGMALRLYLLSGLSFDYAGLGVNFRRIFPAIALLDEVWALSPLFLFNRIGVGPALALTVGMLYLPFSQRTLVRMAYDA